MYRGWVGREGLLIRQLTYSHIHSDVHILYSVCLIKEMDILFAKHDLPGNTVIDIDSLHLHPQVVAGKTIVQRDLGGRHGVVREPRPPALFEKTPLALGGASPDRGEHTGQVLMEVGFSESEVDAMDREGAFGKIGRDGTGDAEVNASRKMTWKKSRL